MGKLACGELAGYDAFVALTFSLGVAVVKNPVVWIVGGVAAAAVLIVGGAAALIVALFMVGVSHHRDQIDEKKINSSGKIIYTKREFAEIFKTLHSKRDVVDLLGKPDSTWDGVFDKGFQSWTYFERIHDEETTLVLRVEIEFENGIPKRFSSKE